MAALRPTNAGQPAVHRAACWCTAMALAWALALVAAGAVGAQQPADGLQYREADVTPAQPSLLLSAPRYTPTIELGSTATIELRLTNPSTRDRRFYLDVAALEPDPSGESMARIGEGVSRAGAEPEPGDPRTWVALPRRSFPLGAGQQAVLRVEITVPEGAEPGVHPVAVLASARVVATGVNTDQEALLAIDATLASQLVITVPGAASSELEVEPVDPPRLVWAGTSPRFDARLYNRGTTYIEAAPTLLIGGFAGRSGSTTVGDPVGLLPDGRRDVSLPWSDPPLFGWYRPAIVAEWGTAEEERVDLPLVVVLPPWWLILLLVLALMLPVAVAWRRQRQRRR